MTAISEDTPEGGPEELQWKIDRLIEQVERHAAEQCEICWIHEGIDWQEALDMYLNA